MNAKEVDWSILYTVSGRVDRGSTVWMSTWCRNEMTFIEEADQVAVKILTSGRIRARWDSTTKYANVEVWFRKLDDRQLGVLAPPYPLVQGRGNVTGNSMTSNKDDGSSTFMNTNSMASVDIRVEAANHLRAMTATGHSMNRDVVSKGRPRRNAKMHIGGVAAETTIHHPETVTVIPVIDTHVEEEAAVTDVVLAMEEVPVRARI